MPKNCRLRSTRRQAVHHSTHLQMNESSIYLTSIISFHFIIYTFIFIFIFITHLYYQICLHQQPQKCCLCLWVQSYPLQMQLSTTLLSKLGRLSAYFPAYCKSLQYLVYMVHDDLQDRQSSAILHIFNVSDFPKRS